MSTHKHTYINMHAENSLICISADKPLTQSSMKIPTPVSLLSTVPDCSCTNGNVWPKFLCCPLCNFHIPSDVLSNYLFLCCLFVCLYFCAIPGGIHNLVLALHSVVILVVLGGSSRISEIKPRSPVCKENAHHTVLSLWHLSNWTKI